jgi:hypothetical protein
MDRGKCHWDISQDQNVQVVSTNSERGTQHLRMLENKRTSFISHAISNTKRKTRIDFQMARLSSSVIFKCILGSSK